MTLPSNSALAGTPTFPFCSWKSLGNAAGLTLEGKMRKFATRCYLVGRHCSEGCNAGLARPFSDDLDETNDEICAKANNSRSVPWDHWECGKYCKYRILSIVQGFSDSCSDRYTRLNSLCSCKKCFLNVYVTIRHHNLALLLKC